VKQHQFEADHAALWQQIAAILDGSEPDRRALPGLYRRLCQCLALCRQRGYSPAVADYLQKMVGDCHRLLYGSAISRPNTVVHMMLIEFPRRVREEWRLLLVALLAVFGVGLAVGVLVWRDPQLAYSFVTSDQLADMRKMYQPSSLKIGRGGSAGDVAMFGHYIWNNVSIGFRSFAAGIAGGVPALVSLAFNGMQVGVIGAWLSMDPVTRHTFWSFVIAHSSVEVTGLVLSGMAGMKLGLALIHPGRMRRGHAVQAASEKMFPVLVGAALMIFLAAFIEAFWSASSAVAPAVKYAVGALCWTLVIGFFAFAGRGKQ
jgi:uncharacterized membrane protein SpoIIM required for sporulation